jgi:hypothetical protein
MQHGEKRPVDARQVEIDLLHQRFVVGRFEKGSDQLERFLVGHLR